VINSVLNLALSFTAMNGMDLYGCLHEWICGCGLHKLVVAVLFDVTVSKHEWTILSS